MSVSAYHERSKHHLQRYAAGPETLDWDAQPDPFRRFAGSTLVTLPLAAGAVGASWADLHDPAARVPAWPVDRRSVGVLFELSFALTAWKQQGPDRWALRATPSSGNLHPTEAYLLAQGVGDDLADGLYHYAPREHALERRASGAAEGGEAAPRLWVGLASIHWREAWKYGERAFRYCQLDLGHALGALRYAAAALGWQLRMVAAGHDELAALLGLDRAGDFGAAEREEPELLLQVGPDLPDAEPPPRWTGAVRWQGRANRLDARPMYRWPVIDQVARASRTPAGAPHGGVVPHAGHAGDVSNAGHAGDVRRAGPVGAEASPPAASAPRACWPAATLIRQRRSAQRFDGRGRLSAAGFFRLASISMPRAGPPWDAWPRPTRLHAVLYALRVDGLAPGAYLLPRRPDGAAVLAEAWGPGVRFEPVPQAPADLPLLRLAASATLAARLRMLACHQAIAADACVVAWLLAEWDDTLEATPWRYRHLLQEAGLIGQTLYLQAEAEGQRATGIGCYFDDAVHELLGIGSARLRAVYHFTVGVPVADPRITTEPPYAQRAAGSDSERTP